MYPFWDPVIAPLVRASRARSIVEIGALRGETTVQMLEDLGPDAELHVIDPLPQFDPAEHERRFPGQYIFHRDLSLNVLPNARAFDVALIDGDHNWYTVYNELRLLREASHREGEPLPLCILHDVGWPYGRRDLYYEPSQIPEEFRQPYARKGMRPGRRELLRGGGMNITLDNALVEGGERNGVRTGLDDFVAEHDKPLRQVIIPIYFGLAIVAEEDFLAVHPEVTELLDHLESPDGVREMLELSEDIRLEGVVFEHNIDRMNRETLDRAQRRYLDLLKNALLDVHYLDNEMRIEHLLDCVRGGGQPNPDVLRSPGHNNAGPKRKIVASRNSIPSTPQQNAGHFSYATSRITLDHLDDALRVLHGEGIAGDLVEVGCARGGASILMRGFLEAVEDTQRTVWVSDEFRSTPPDGARPIREVGTVDLWSGLNEVREGFDNFDLLDDRVRFLVGDPADSLIEAQLRDIALLHIGSSTPSAAAATLDRIGDRVVEGGIVIIDLLEDATSSEIEAHRARRTGSNIDRVGFGGAAWRVGPPAERRLELPKPSASPSRAPLVAATGTDSVDLSVIVAAFDMAREMPRTLHSLSRTYQRDVDDLAYEVIVVDNGSSADQRLEVAGVEAFGPEFRLVSLDDDAHPSPTSALNKAIASARGDAFALMIDGAHMLTPGVLSHGMRGLKAYAPAVVATQQWYLGPGQQPDAVASGYDQSFENRLLESISWPENGYRLFEIGHFIGNRDWLDGMHESNCLFAPRSLLAQTGAFDDGFSMPGAGYANLELYERLAAHPGTTLVTILGEGSFHQVHGGTTTNDGVLDERRAKTFRYSEHYQELRGRRMQGPPRNLHYVGSFAIDSSRRTRSRRLEAARFQSPRAEDGLDGIPSEPELIPDDAASAFTEQAWRTLAWKEGRWLDAPATAAPTDLFALQEILVDTAPSHVIVTTSPETPATGTADFVASICGLRGGTVIAVGDGARAKVANPDIIVIDSPPQGTEARKQVEELLGDDPNALVILSSGAPSRRIIAEFNAYRFAVPVGGFVVIENTIFNGRPVWPGYGQGPYEATQRILGANGDFVADTSKHQWGLSFNPGGFLRRHR